MRLAQGEDEVQRILKICILILRNRWQSTCVVLMRFRVVITLEESQLEELRIRKLKNGKATGGDDITGEMI